MLVLAATKVQAEGRRHPEGSRLRTMARETGITTRAISGIAQGTIRQSPKDVLLAFCTYVGCELGDLLFLAEEGETL